MTAQWLRTNGPSSLELPWCCWRNCQARVALRFTAVARMPQPTAYHRLLQMYVTCVCCCYGGCPVKSGSACGRSPCRADLGSSDILTASCSAFLVVYSVASMTLAGVQGAAAHCRCCAGGCAPLQLCTAAALRSLHLGLAPVPQGRLWAGSASAACCLTLKLWPAGALWAEHPAGPSIHTIHKVYTFFVSFELCAAGGGRDADYSLTGSRMDQIMNGFNALGRNT